MRHLRRALLKRRVHKNPIWVTIPARRETRTQIIELHLLDNETVKDLSVSRVVVKNEPVTIFLRRPHVRPMLPVTLVAQIDGEKAMEVRKAFFRKEVQGQSDTR